MVTYKAKNRMCTGHVTKKEGASVLSEPLTTSTLIIEQSIRDVWYRNAHRNVHVHLAHAQFSGHTCIICTCMAFEVPKQQTCMKCFIQC